jgi:3-oxoacyl-[acyl-carrier protein] reductase
MVNKLEGKIAIITGGGRGIGRGIALEMAAEGAKVIVNDIGRDNDGSSFADKVVQEIRQNKGIAASQLDSVATMNGGANIIKAALDNFGGINILVNCAGNHWNVPTIDMTEEQWDSIISVHLKGHFACTKAALPHMIQQNYGRIINISSRAAFDGLGNLAYATVKAGILGFTSMLSRELKSYNITVNSVLPSAITELFPGEKGKTGDNMPFYKNPGPDMIAPLVTYLATNEAAGINGKFFYAAAGDVCVYMHPFRLSAANSFIRKPNDKWTVAELGEVIPPILGLSN